MGQFSEGPPRASRLGGVQPEGGVGREGGEDGEQVGVPLRRPEGVGEDQGDGAGALRLAADEAGRADDVVSARAHAARVHPGTEPRLHLGPIPRLLPVAATQFELDAVLGGDDLSTGLGQGGVVLRGDELDVWRGLDAD